MKKDLSISIQRSYDTLKSRVPEIVDLDSNASTNASEIVEPPKDSIKLDDEAKQAIYQIVRGEMDTVLIERLEALYAYELNANGTNNVRPPRLLTTPLAELSIRKNTYTRISETLNKRLSTSEVGFEYNAVRKRIEIQRLREHNISPIIHYIIPKSASASQINAANLNENSMAPSENSAIDIVTNTFNGFPIPSSAIDEDYVSNCVESKMENQPQNTTAVSNSDHLENIFVAEENANLVLDHSIPASHPTKVGSPVETTHIANNNIDKNINTYDVAEFELVKDD
jgi:hypothetical protein